MVNPTQIEVKGTLIMGRITKLKIWKGQVFIDPQVPTEDIKLNRSGF